MPIYGIVFLRNDRDLTSNRQHTFLTALAAIVAVPLAMFIDISTAKYRNWLIDWSADVVRMSSISLSEFLIAYIRLLIYAISTKIFPALFHISPKFPLFRLPKAATRWSPRFR